MPLLCLIIKLKIGQAHLKVEDMALWFVIGCSDTGGKKTNHSKYSLQIFHAEIVNDGQRGSNDHHRELMTGLIFLTPMSWNFLCDIKSSETIL